MQMVLLVNMDKLQYMSGLGGSVGLSLILDLLGDSVCSDLHVPQLLSEGIASSGGSDVDLACEGVGVNGDLEPVKGMCSVKR